MPNRYPLTAKPVAPARQQPRVPFGAVLINWAALVALWALPYLAVLDHLRPDAARSETLQWLLFGVGALGVASLLFAARRGTRDPQWRAKHGLVARDSTDKR